MYIGGMEKAEQHEEGQLGPVLESMVAAVLLVCCFVVVIGLSTLNHSAQILAQLIHEIQIV